MSIVRAAKDRRERRAPGVPANARLRCPHDIDHPRWCPICQVHWQARMRHPSWPREPQRAPR